MTDEQNIERGAAEDAAGAPVTPTDIDASRKPPSESGDESVTSGDGSGVAGGSSGGGGGTSNMPGHPDAS